MAIQCAIGHGDGEKFVQNDTMLMKYGISDEMCGMLFVAIISGCRMKHYFYW